VRGAEWLAARLLFLARHPFFARRALEALERSGALFQALLRVQAGADLGPFPAGTVLRLSLG
jgi:hypothetical protein